ncbi:MAG: S8 family serine peptidase [Chloroflexi bacterium]|nr:S8 family serine peptidase [Chloroflexota bacterium]
MALTSNWRKRWLVGWLMVGVLFAAALPTAVARPDDVSSPAADPLGKISAWVLEHTVDGAQAEMLVVLRQQGDLSGAAQKPTKLEKGRYVYDTLYQTAQATQGPIIQWLTARGIEHRAYYIVNLIWVKADRAAALALAARSDVARIDGNTQIRLPLPTEPLLLSELSEPDAVEPGVTYIKAPQVWATGYTGQGIVVGGQDTGIQWDHPALKEHYRGWDGATANHDFNWHDAIHTTGSSCGANSPVPCDDHGHGTHTIGTAVGSDGGTNQIGVAPGAKFIGCRNMNAGVGSPATYIECFEFFLAPYPVSGGAGNPALAPDVTNNSWGCPPDEGCNAASLLAAVQAQRAAGIMTVTSAGNEGPSCNTVQDPPGIYDEVYSVGALTTSTDSIASFSSRGAVTVDGSNRTKPDIAAPGTSTRSSLPGNGYGSLSGTSMASPHVAGAVALLWSARPELKNQIDATEQALNNSAVHINSATCDPAGTTWPNNTFGYGRLDILAAAQPTAGLALTPSAAAQSAAVGDTVAYTLRFTNTGSLSDTFGVSLSGAQWPVTTSLVTTGVIGPNVGTPVTISVTVPLTATGNATDSVAVKIASLATPAISATARFTTTALPSYSAALTSQVTAQAGYVGHTVMYTVRLTNTGTITDDYLINHDRKGWVTTLEPGYQQLPPQAGVDILAQVTIPLTATHGQTDTVQVFVNGAVNEYRLDLVTTALTYRVFLPIVLGGE